jgi:heme/copper-type cytochrome/quinol oxidase subunit 2
MRMRLTAIGSVVAVAVVGILVGLAAGQATQPRPGPGSGVMPIEGTVTVTNIPGVAVTNTPGVTISNTPTVLARQSGDWKVAVSALPAVRLAAPTFLREGRTYRFTWPSGQQDELAVKSISDGWLFGDRVEGGARAARWVNPAMAVAIETR